VSEWILNGTPAQLGLTM